MSKAILVLNEMPKCCIECQFFGDRKGYDRYDKCFANGETIIGQDNKRWNNCPLKEMPHKKKLKPLEIGNMFELVGFSTMKIQVENVFINGFNDCIDEILGEEK